jgi:hypothetical protein
MQRIHDLLVVVAALMIIGLPVSASAQPPRTEQGRPQQPRRAAPPTDDMSPAQVHQLFDAMLVMQSQNALSLTETQYSQFLTRLRPLQEARRRNQQERVRLMNELQRLVGPRSQEKPPESEVRVRLNALRELETRSATELRRAYDAIDEVLTPLQQGRFRVLEEQIERRKLELVGRARQGKR